MTSLGSDLRFAVRTLLKSPLFTVVAIVSLALGIGANTAIFTLVDRVLLRLLPVKQPEQLVLLNYVGLNFGSNNGANAISYPMYRDLRDRNTVFSGLLCRYRLPLSLGYQGQTERMAGELVSGSYFQVLGARAALGRTFTPEDDRIPSGHPLVMLSYDYWTHRFHSDASLVGRTLLVNSYPLTVIGVAEPGFYGVELGYEPKLFVPVAMKKEMAPAWWFVYNLENRRAKWVNVFGRLKPGFTRRQAKAALQPPFHSILEMEMQQKEFAKATAYVRDRFRKNWLDVLPAAQGRSFLRQQYRTPLMVLMSIVGLVLLIACANVANLLLARAAGRRKEIALRLTLGAGRGRIVRQTLVESLLLSLAGGAAGLLVALWTDRLLLGFIPQGDSTLNLPAAPDLRILAFTLGASVLTGVLFGLAPALQSMRVDLAPTLKEQASNIGGGGARLRQSLVVAQVFLSVLLLIGAGLFVRTLRNLQTLDPGFRTANLITFDVDPPLNGYSKERTKTFFRQLKERLDATAGVENSALALVRIADGDEWDNSVQVEGYNAKPGEDTQAYFNALSPGYFASLGIPIAMGRDFTSTDEASPHKVGIVNEAFVRYFFGNRSPLGRHFTSGGGKDIEIIGVVKDFKYQDLREKPHRQTFIAYQQAEYAMGMTAYVSTRVNPEQMFSVVRRAVHDLDPNLPVFALRTMRKQVQVSLSTERLVATLAAIFGVLATLLAAVGLYGLMAYNVARRTREIGIRMALGALRGDVTWLVMKEVLALVAAGAAIGLPAAWGLTRVVKALLYDVSPNDPLSMAAAVLALAAVGLLAGYLPALRAARTDPNRALRYE